jgi:hypothetical protein
MLTHFRFARYNFVLTAMDPLDLPPYKGSTLRGVFGHAFKRIVCARQGQDCAECLLRLDCPYASVFESRPPDDADIKRLQEAIPRPFVVEPPLIRQTRFSPGEEIAFKLVLVGRAIDLLAYFVVAFQEAGRMGIGKGRGQYALARVETAPWDGRPAETVYTRSLRSSIVKRDCALCFPDLIERARALASDGTVTLRFLTPTRIRERGRWTARPAFDALVRTLLQRISSLARFHCAETWEYDFRGAIDRAWAVQIVADHTHWDDWERYSTRQEQRVKLGGFLGQVTYAGDLDEFMPLLLAGSMVHVGKGTVFGNGQYTMFLSGRDREAILGS